MTLFLCFLVLNNILKIIYISDNLIQKSYKRLSIKIQSVEAEERDLEKEYR